MNHADLTSRTRTMVRSLLVAYVLSGALAIWAHHILVLGPREGVRQWFEIGGEVLFVVLTGAFAIYVGRSSLDLFRRTDRERRESEARYESLVSSVDDLVFTLDKERRFSGVYGSWMQRHGFSPGALLGRLPDEIFGPENAGLFAEAFVRVRKGETARIEWSATIASRFRHYQTTFSPVTGAASEDFAVGVTREITEQKRLGMSLEATTEKLHAIVDSAPLAIFTLDVEGRIQSVNAAGIAMFGIDDFALFGQPFVPEGDSAEIAARLRDVAAGGPAFSDVDVWRTLPSGRRVLLNISAASLSRRSAGLRSVVATAIDVTSQRQAEETLKRYRFLAQHTRDVVLFVGPDGRIADANEAALSVYGYDLTEMAGLPASKICGGEPCSICGGTATGPGDLVEETHYRKDGAAVAVEVSAVGADINDERFTLVIARDIRARRRRQLIERMLHDVDRCILQNQPLDVILSLACDKIAEAFGFPVVQLSLKGEDGRVDIRTGAGERMTFLNKIEVRWDDTPAGRGPTGTAIRTGKQQVRDLRGDPDFAPWRERALLHGLRTSIAIPLQSDEQVLGALTLFSSDVAPLDDTGMTLLLMCADQLALSLQYARSQERIALQTVALEAAANGVVVVGLDGRIQWVNPAFERLTGYAKHEAIGKTPALLKSGNHSASFYRQMWQTVRSGRVWSGELYNRRKDGTLYIEEQTITPVRSIDGTITSFVAIKQDVTSRKHQEEQIRHLAMHDALTDLPNRRSFDAMVERLCVEARHGVSSAILIFDIDNFKVVNDGLGHLTGDRVLADLARLIRETLRGGDFLARLGGDEFAVLLHGTTMEEAEMIAERLRALVGSYVFRSEGRVFEVTTSIGVAVIDATSDVRSVMVQADAALYAAKDQGRNRVVTYANAGPHRARFAEAGKWATRIKSALRENRFEVHYQPIVRMGNNTAEHYEALVRMIDVDGHTIPPDQFISAAERFGLMSEIDLWVVSHVIDVIRDLPDARIFVNLSGASLTDESLLESIQSMIVAAQLAPGRLAFEITESAAVTDLGTAQNWIRKLKDLGCLFALDDFGVGFSSFSYLRALSADYVKIDRSFVSDLDTNATNRALVMAVKTIAETLGKEVIAEGVETEAHAVALQELGIELAQGYRWGRPIAEMRAVAFA